MYIFFIKVPKYQHIFVRINISIMVMIFDGPGYLSKAISKTKNSTVLLSSFQCLLKMESHKFIHLRDIMYKGIIRYSKEILLVKKVNTFRYDDSFNVHAKHFVLLLKSHIRSKISVFLSEFYFHTLKDDINCKYGGISMFDLKHGQMEETMSVCIIRGDDRLYLQPYYSKSNESLIVIYSYPYYSKISVLLNITWSYCHVVEINVCATKQTCHISSNLCSLLFEGQEVNIRAERREPLDLLTVLPLEEKCIVLLFLNSPFYKPPVALPSKTTPSSCDIEFFIDNSQYSLTYQYKVTGYFSIQDSFLDTGQSFSVHSGQTNFVVSGNDVSKFQQSFQERMPTHGDTMQFIVGLRKGKSWVQFHISKLPTSTDVVEQIQINKTNQIYVCRIFENQILNISINADDLTEKQVTMEVTIETQVIVGFFF